MIRNLLLLCAALLIGSHADATDVTVKNVVPQDFKGELKPDITTADNLKSDERQSGDQVKFTITLPDTSASELIDVSLSPGVSGYGKYSQTFEIPYFATSEQYYPSIVPDTSSDEDLREFVKQASINHSDQDQYRFQQRALVLFHAIMTRGVTPPDQKVPIAYWLLQSTSTLISAADITIDPDVYMAADKLTEWIGPGGQYEKSFYKTYPGIKPSDVAYTLNAVAMRDRTVRSALIQELDDGTLRSATRSNACKRATSLRTTFESEKRTGKTMYDGWTWQYILVLGIPLKCQYSMISDLITQSKPVSTDMAENASYDLHQLAELVDAYQASSEKGPQRDVSVRRSISAARLLAGIVPDVQLPDELATFR